MIITNGFLSIAGTDLSDYVLSGSLSYGAETQDDTVWTDDTKKSEGGLKNWSVTAELKQDFAVVDALLFDLVGTAVAVIIRKDGGAVSASNPNFTGSAILTKYDPVGGSAGDKAKCSIELTPAGTLSRATS